MNRRDLEKIAQRMENQMLRTFADILDSVRGSARIGDIERLIDAGRIDEVIGLLDLDPVTWQPLEESIREAFKTGGETGVQQIGKVETGDGLFTPRFSIRDPRAERWLEQKSSGLITELVGEQREAIRQRLIAGMEAGRNPRRTALDIVGRVGPSGNREGGFIGLTSNQAKWVDGAREKVEALDSSYFDLQLRDRRFDARVRRAIEDGKPVPQNIVDKIVTRYQARATNYRGQVIGRTESLNALRAGQFEAVEQAVEGAGEDMKETVKVWDATADARTRNDHLLMEGKTAPVDEPFTLPDGSKMMHPGDSTMGAPAGQVIQCRCSVSYRVNFGARAKRLEGFR